MHSSLLTVGILFAFGAPWTWLLQRRSIDATLDGFIQRVALGYAISFVALFVVAQCRLWLFTLLWCGGALACLIDVFRQRTRALSRPRWTVEGTILLLSSALYLALRSLPVLSHRAPTGWDAYFHMTIAEQIVAQGRAVHDWLPYE
ncbi:MAG TPA: hypothetical protein VHZ95_22095, partial [Polyangiales bacterium]|nr:hypothetical protein [Polyangiales bacterium]